MSLSRRCAKGWTQR